MYIYSSTQNSTVKTLFSPCISLITGAIFPKVNHASMKHAIMFRIGSNSISSSYDIVLHLGCVTIPVVDNNHLQFWY